MEILKGNISDGAAAAVQAESDGEQILFKYLVEQQKMIKKELEDFENLQALFYRCVKRK